MGCLIYTGCMPLLVFVFAMSSLSGGAYDEGTRDWWEAVLGTMFRPGDAGPVTLTLLVGTVVALLLIGHGLWRKIGRVRVTTWRLMVAVLVVALGLALDPLGFLMAVLSPVVLTLLALLSRPGSASGREPDDRQG